ncbi:MAG TPA: NADPH-dependent F420 reductase [Actinomycetota bacterium]|nr:NADPH-dependent F420 reductase [Actinomycetota bacterium]
MTVDRVAVVGGTGDIGFALASRWAKAGIGVVIGSRDAGRAKEAADRLLKVVPGADVQGLENAEAVASVPTVLVAVPFSGLVPIYKSIAESLSADSIVIDATVPVEASVGGKATHVFGVWEGSAAQLGLAFLPKGTKVCAAFHTLSASAVAELETPLEGDVLVCGSKAGKEIVRGLVEVMPDLRFVDAGPLENARIIEPITALLIGINHRYKIDRAGIHITGLPKDF